MANADNPGSEYAPGTVDENTHGWAQDGPGSDEAKERAVAANKKAWEANDTQDEATGAARQGPDLTGGNVGESSTRRAEDIAGEDGKEAGRQDGPAQGESQRPTGTSASRDSTGVDPQEPTEEGSPRLQTGDQGG
jgi:hypothetical protein